MIVAGGIHTANRLPSISSCLIRHGLPSGYVRLDDAAFRHAAPRR